MNGRARGQENVPESPAPEGSAGGAEGARDTARRQGLSGSHAPCPPP
ncbi:hypothetical protein BN2537_1173 [Streptomyces venezuelae]|nr:hypothetical protein BN2537_1173 [Streptomyces venezuelae]